MDEVEVKVLDVDRNALVKKLLSLGATKYFEGEIHAVSFDYPDNSIKKAKRTLRLRTKGDKTYLTLKNPIDNPDIKIREEIELEVSDFAAMKKILESLNLKQWRDVKKTRISYKLKDALFEFDKYHGEFEYIPEFVEIEVMATDDKEAIKKIYEYTAILGIKKEQCLPWTLNELTKHYKK
ncbi:MAG: class IV adenylate cyclase [Candidatus Nanoarchaeia archaeon]|nr:class IV adenylate cyclase [Candidatus Nanoarchaeia archaeon]